MRKKRLSLLVILLLFASPLFGCDAEDVASVAFGVVSQMGFLPGGSLGGDWFEDDESGWDKIDQDVEWLLWPVSELF